MNIFFSLFRADSYVISHHISSPRQQVVILFISESNKHPIEKGIAMQTNDEEHALEKKKTSVVIDRTECSVPCTTERLNEGLCRLASTVSQETASTTTSGNLKHAFSSPLQRGSSRNREQNRDSENAKMSLKACVISILAAKPCGMTQLKKKLLETKGVSVVGCRGSCAKQESVRYVNQEELSVLLKQICVYKPPGMYVLREEYHRDPATSHIAHPSQEDPSMDGLQTGLELGARGGWSQDIETKEEYDLYCAEYEEKYDTAFRIHQQLRMMQTAREEESQKNSLYSMYTHVREHLERIKYHIERYQERFQ